MLPAGEEGICYMKSLTNRKTSTGTARVARAESDWSSDFFFGTFPWKLLEASVVPVPDRGQSRA